MATIRVAPTEIEARCHACLGAAAWRVHSEHRTTVGRVAFGFFLCTRHLRQLRAAITKIVDAGRYDCHTCGSKTPGPQLRDPVWADIQSTLDAPTRFLCLPCMEAALGRRIVRADLKPVPINGHFGRWIEEERT